MVVRRLVKSRFWRDIKKACEVVILWSLGRSSQGFLRILGPGKKKFFFFFWEKKTQEVGKYPLRKIFFYVSESRMSFKNGKDLHWKKFFLSFYKKSWIFPKKWQKKLCRVTHAKYLIFQEMKKKNFPNVQKNSVVVTFFLSLLKNRVFWDFFLCSVTLGTFFFHLLKY